MKDQSKPETLDTERMLAMYALAVDEKKDYDITFRAHRPAFIDGPRIETKKLNLPKDILNLEEVKRFKKDKFYSYAFSSETEKDIPSFTLMAMNKYDAKYYGCKGWWVIGFVSGVIPYQLELPSFESLKALHRVDCSVTKYDTFLRMSEDKLGKELIRLEKDSGFYKSGKPKCSCGLEEEI